MNPRFVADVMVGKLARWLRILGLDVLYNNRFEDAEFLRIAREEDRLVLTRDVELHDLAQPGSILIERDDFKKQVQQVVRKCGIRQFALLSRCAECNTPLTAADKESIFSRIPPYVYLTHDRFAYCSRCDRIYWEGTHTDSMHERTEAWIREILDSPGDGHNPMEGL